MKVAVATVQVPFIQGGAEVHAAALVQALRERGHQAELVTAPFELTPPARVRASMAWWAEQDFTLLSGHVVDRLICLKFPAFYARHPNKAAWILHPYREVYDAWCEPDAGPAGRDLRELRAAVHAADRRAYPAFAARFSCSQSIARLMKEQLGVVAPALYHPPPRAERYYCAPALPYVFFPGRLEDHKRQWLLIEAMRHVRAPVVALCAGDGGARPLLRERLEKLGLGDRVRLLGPVHDAEELLAYYAHATAVFFGSAFESYGYVTLEAMLASKPVITCTDSGGPQEFVVDGETGYVVPPEPEAVAAALDRLCGDPAAAARMGRAGAERYRSLGITWDRVVESLLYTPAGGAAP
jgi:glycosyltransferase involved in cell wall biosynthesis